MPDFQLRSVSGEAVLPSLPKPDEVYLSYRYAGKMARAGRVAFWKKLRKNFMVLLQANTLIFLVFYKCSDYDLSDIAEN